MELDRKDINDRAFSNYEEYSRFFNVEEQAWQIAVYELALETLGVDPIKLWAEYPQEHCCGKIDGITPDHSNELECECCNGSCAWCN
jgi:hypothetical protein